MLQLKTDQVQEIWQVQLFDILSKIEQRVLIPTGIIEEEETLLFSLVDCVKTFAEPSNPKPLIRMLIDNERQRRALNNTLEVSELKEEIKEMEKVINKKIIDGEVGIFDSLEDMVSLNVTIMLLQEKVDGLRVN